MKDKIIELTKVRDTMEKRYEGEYGLDRFEYSPSYMDDYTVEDCIIENTKYLYDQLGTRLFMWAKDHLELVNKELNRLSDEGYIINLEDAIKVAQVESYYDYAIEYLPTVIEYLFVTCLLDRGITKVKQEALEYMLFDRLDGYSQRLTLGVINALADDFIESEWTSRD